jgi:hypothetical protein
MRPDPVGVQGEPVGELVGGGTAPEFAEEREQPAAGRLGEQVIDIRVGEVDTRQFSHLSGRTP